MADFSNTDLTQANFCGASLVEADLRGASLSNTRFDGAALSDAKFENVDFAAGSFAGCALREAKVGHFLWGNQDVFHPPVTFSGSVFPVRLFEDFLMMAGTMFPRDQIEGGDSDDATPAELTYLREYRDLLTFFMDAQVNGRSTHGPDDPSLTGVH
ncbi:MAG: pentapeptide repeat-containing protein [Acetobacteraceae bacterium]